MCAIHADVLQKATTPSASLVRPRSTLQGMEVLQALQGCEDRRGLPCIFRARTFRSYQFRWDPQILPYNGSPRCSPGRTETLFSQDTQSIQYLQMWRFAISTAQCGMKNMIFLSSCARKHLLRGPNICLPRKKCTCASQSNCYISRFHRMNRVPRPCLHILVHICSL